MASSSSSSSSAIPYSSQSPKKYDVFISFRGEDVRFKFVSHLYEGLRRNHIETYIDYRLEKGDEVWPALEKAIEDSTLFLVIFSENYASSTWCLKELTKILDCSSKNQAHHHHHLVMPVFYGVDPSHVRKQSGSYQRAFEQHERRSINNQQLEKWREALFHTANISGWPCDSDRNEAELILEIVKAIKQKLAKKYNQSEDYLKDKIGIHKRMAHIESLMDKCSNDVQFIGIWGMGGMGKTTLAKAIFKKYWFTYEGHCFLANVSEEYVKCGKVSLREKLIFTLLGDKEDGISPYAMTRLGRKKVFIVLDDVDHHEQLENLVESHGWLGVGSKILITTRDKGVFGNKVKMSDIYKLAALNYEEAFQLFSLNAFEKDSVDSKLTSLAKKVTSYADGNPLALKLLGAFLYGKNQEEWESQLKKLKKLPYSQINNILKLSVEGLDFEEKNIFLDIACFFNNYSVEDLTQILEARGYSAIIGLRNLEDKALLEIDGRRIYMHPLIKEMGRQLLREESLNNPKGRSRLWDPGEIFEILKENMGSEAIEGITFNLSKVEEMCLNPRAFGSMPNLKFLIIYRNFNEHGENKLKFPDGIEILSNKLIVLSWVGCPLKSLPTTFKAESLVKINFSESNLTKLWHGVQNLANLSSIDLRASYNLIELPDFSKAKRLEKVYLNSCSNLQSIHSSILSLNSLSYLSLRQCKALTSLTSNTHLKSLRNLSVEGCISLREFSVTSENCDFELDLSGTSINDCGHVRKIDSLIVERCSSLESLPYDKLRILRRLSISHCNKLAWSLDSTIFDMLRGLKVLRLAYCSELSKLPDNIGLLSSLRELDLSSTNIETLPPSIKHLSSLKSLNLAKCQRLRSLPELPPSISQLIAPDCPSLETLHLPLTNKCEERKENKTSAWIIFTNCMKLDRQSIKAAEAKMALDIINKGIYNFTMLGYPGKGIPEWFLYKNTEPFLTVDLNLISEPWDFNFIFCVVISESPGQTWIDVNCFVDGQYSYMPHPYPTGEFSLSDHVFLWYVPSFGGELERKIEEKKRDAETNTCLPWLRFEFAVSCDCGRFYARGCSCRIGRIKECGVCPTSALEYQNYIQQFKLALEEPSRSRKYKYQLDT